MRDKLKPLAERIAQTEAKMRENALLLRKENKKISGSPEDRLLLVVQKVPLSGLSIVAVDSGILADRIHGSDIIIGKPAAVNFVYNNSGLVSCSHFPVKFPEPQIEIKTGLEEHEALVFRQLFRLKLEISAAIETLGSFNPNIMLLDGSIIPLGSDRPPAESSIFPVYSELIALYLKLFSLCQERNCMLVGVIKDSRGKRLIDLLALDHLHISDSYFVNFLLEEAERTAIVSYASEKKKTPVMKDLNEFGECISLFYLKSSKTDLPLRIEFLKYENSVSVTSDKSVDWIASVLLSLCSISKNFAYPACLIEADMCAIMNPLEMEGVKKDLFLLSEGSLQELRRNSRPFR